MNSRKEPDYEAKLDDAVLAHREALKVWTHERVVPLDWAGTQMNLGNSLLRRGERNEDLEKLDDAVKAYRQALQENTRARVPLLWAKSSGNQGVALMPVGSTRYVQFMERTICPVAFDSFGEELDAPDGSP